MNYKKILLGNLLVFAFMFGNAKDLSYNLPRTSNTSANQNKTHGTCAQASAFTDLDINNVRAKILNGGDMWWDRGTSTARYEVPKGSSKNSLFAGSVWIGGYDAGGNLRVAAQTYRQGGGNDYWPGPLNNSASTADVTCNAWDKIWKINLTDILTFQSAFTAGNFDPNDSRFASILTYPGYNNPYAAGAAGATLQNEFNIAGRTAKDFAPFVDVDGDLQYNPTKGDYPKIKGDQFLWWIFNDAGSNKTETNTQSIGLEVHAQAFAFLTNDQLNNATFYNYKLFTRSTTQLDSCSISTWTDADLGYYNDDYVGCDTGRSLGILYNGDDFDGTGLPSEYGANIPMIGIDFFEGPKDYRYNADSGKLVLTQLGMSSFIFYNNDNSTNLGNPQRAIEFYRYMTGTMRNGNEYTQTCNAVDPSINKTKFVYTGDPGKPFNLQSNWTECGCGNQPGDRRFVHSSGAFTLRPGSEPINVTIGAVWYPHFDYPCPSLSNLLLADDKAQELFDRNFIPIAPPQAPILTMRELDQKLVLFLDNPVGSNNYNETYGVDFKEYSTKAINLGYSQQQAVYKFEGYKIFQVSDSTVTSGDIYNEDGTVNSSVARLAFQCDIKNGVGTINNFIEDADAGTPSAQYSRREMVRGQDKGITKSFLATKDLFSSTGADLVNYKRYYYIAVAYAYNNFKEFNPQDANSTQNIAYLESFKNGYGQGVRSVTGIPNAAYTEMGNQIRADYGDGVEVTVLEGKGNGGNFLVLKQESELNALFGGANQAASVVYEKGSGPIDVSVVDPVKIPNADFEVWLTGPNAPAGVQDTSKGLIPNLSTWFIHNTTTNDTIFAGTDLTNVSDKLLANYGLSVRINQVERPGDNIANMGLIGDTIIYSSPNFQWLSGVVDQDGETALNWIRSGSTAEAGIDPGSPYVRCDHSDFAYVYNDNLKRFMDPNSIYEKMIGGTWAPYILAANDNREQCGFGIAYNPNIKTVNVDADNKLVSGFFNDNSLSSSRSNNPIQRLQGVDIIMTPDRTKWSRCIVVEMRDAYQMNGAIATGTFAEGSATKFDLRRHSSLNIDPDGNGAPSYSSDASDYGMSWFPGYAINVETGERLNIFFGEDSYLTDYNGKDMIWNPTDNSSMGVGDFIGAKGDFDPLYGGKHTIYVSNVKYDGCADFASKLKQDEGKSSASSRVNKRAVYESIIWMGLPLVKYTYQLSRWNEGLIPVETRLRLRTNVPYQKYTGNPGFTLKNAGNPRYFFTTKDQSMVKWTGGDKTQTQNLLDRIRIVPNPYYAYSAYEWNRLDNRVKIINLPSKATVKVYSLDGVLVRSLSKSDATSYIEWDLKNNAGIMISGGAYLIHVQATGIGETVLKWFAAVRPTDITTF